MRKIADGKQTLFIGIVDYKPEFRFSMALTTRLEEVQQIVNQFSGTTPKYYKTTQTTLTRLDWFVKTDKPLTQYSVSSAADIVAAVRALAPVIEQQLVPFFDRYQDVQGVDVLLNQLQPSPDRTDMPVRGITALVVARLAGNPRFEELAAKYLAQVQGVPATLQKFTRLVEQLRAHSAT